MLLRQLHQRAAGVNQKDPRANARKCHRRPLMNLDLQAVGHEPHHAGRLDPRDLFQLSFLLAQRYKKDVATNVGAHDFHDLRLGHVLHALDVDVVARLDAEAPRTFAVVIQRRSTNPRCTQDQDCNAAP